MKARDLMTAHPSVVTRDDSVAKAARIMRDRHLGLLPVLDDLSSRRLVGVLTDHDIIVRNVARGHDIGDSVRVCATSGDLATVPLDAEASDVLSLMERRSLRRLPVLDADGRVVGVITLTDLAQRLRPSDPVGFRAVEQRVSGALAQALR